MYVPRDGFTLIVSKESIWSGDDRGEQNRESVRIVYIRVFVTRRTPIQKNLGVCRTFQQLKSGLKAAKYEIQKPSICCATVANLLRDKL